MSDYTELVKQLKLVKAGVPEMAGNYIDWTEHDKNCYHASIAAADAITELQAKVAELNDYNANMIENYQSEITELQAKCEAYDALTTKMLECMLEKGFVLDFQLLFRKFIYLGEMR